MNRNTKAILYYAAIAIAVIGVHVVAVMMIQSEPRGTSGTPGGRPSAYK